MPAPVSRLSQVRPAGRTHLETMLAAATPAPRTLATRVPTAAELDALATITATKLRRLSTSRVPAEKLAAYAAALEAQRRKGEINTPLRVTHFLSQLSHECMRFARMTENFAYKPASALKTFPSKIKSEEQAAELLAADKTGEAFANVIYGDRSDIGNTQPGDGYRFRGRGFIQLTGRANYKSMSDLIAVQGVDLIADPDRAAEPDIAARIAVAFWTSRKINQIADRDDVGAVTRVINGKALKGLEDRRQLLELARNAFYPRT